MFHHEPEENLWYYCPNACCQSPQEVDTSGEDNSEDDSASLASTVSDGDENTDYSDGTSGGEH